jgi:RNA polymerase sigma-70 factor (ECF subfamily)
MKATTLQPDTAFTRLLAQVQAGDEDAARQVCERYGPHIIRAVRRRLHARLRSKFDSTDFSQDVWASFFTKVVEKCDLDNPEDLIRLLTAMARNKVLLALRARTRRQKRDIQREVSLEDKPGGGSKLAAVQQTPSQIAMGEEAWHQLLAKQPPVTRRILLLLRRGYSHERIAAELGISLRTVQRLLRTLST